MHRWRGGAGGVSGLRVIVGLALLLLASCGAAPPRRHGGAAGGGDFMGVTQARCAQGDEGACRILRAMGR